MRSLESGLKSLLPGIVALVALGSALAFFPVALLAQTGNGIYRPEPGDTLAGVVIIEGTAVDPSFLRYEVAFRRLSGPGGDWIAFAQGDQPVIGGTLAVWDTTVGGEANPVFPDGRYQLRLRVVRLDYNYDEYFVDDLSLANLSATPTITTTVTATLPAELAPSAAGTVLAPAAPAVLPSLTPFPTPSPLPTQASAALGAGQEAANDESGSGLAEQISSIDLALFGQAFWRGVTIVFYVFLALGLYLVLRGLARYLLGRWRSGRSN